VGGKTRRPWLQGALLDVRDEKRWDLTKEEKRRNSARRKRRGTKISRTSFLEGGKKKPPDRTDSGKGGAC